MAERISRSDLRALAGVKLQLEAAEAQIENQRAHLARIDEQIGVLRADHAALGRADFVDDGQRESLTRLLNEAQARKAETELRLEHNLSFVKWARSILGEVGPRRPS